MIRLSLPYPPFQLEIFELNSHLRRILRKTQSMSSMRFVHPFLRDGQKYPLPSPPRSYCPVSSRVRSGRERNSSIRIRRRSLQRNRRLLNLLPFFWERPHHVWPGFFFLDLLIVRNVMGGHGLLPCHPVRHYEAVEFVESILFRLIFKSMLQTLMASWNWWR